VSISHEKKALRPDNDDPGDIQPSDWNSEHVITGVLGKLDALAVLPNTIPSIGPTGAGLALQVTMPSKALLAAQTIAEMVALLGVVTPDSPNFLGNPRVPTADIAANNDTIANTAFVKLVVANLIAAAPETLDTLAEMAAALDNDPSFATTITNLIGTKLAKDQNLNDLTDKPAARLALGLKTVAATGAYADLTGKPSLFSGNYADLAGKPAFVAVATSGAYGDLSGRPTLGSAASKDVGTAAGNVLQLDANGKIPAVDGSQVIGVGGFQTGTVMLFIQTSAPVGWTKSTAHNDKALRIVSGAASSGGVQAFSTSFGRTGTDAYTPDSNYMPYHAHTSYDCYINSSVTGWTPSFQSGDGSDNVNLANGWVDIGRGTAAAGASWGHAHGIDLRVQYVDAIIATKN